jgi:hypothetical protein
MDTVPLIVDPGGGTVLLGTDDLDLDYQGGFRLTASAQINQGNDVEFEFFHLGELGDSAMVSTPGAQMTVYGADFGADPINLNYDTKLYNYEINWRHSWYSGRFATLLGFRGAELGENMMITDAASPPHLFLGDVDNHILGVQIGIEGDIIQNSHWDLETGLKCGLYNNSASFDAAFPQAGPAAVFQAEANHATFIGELWLGANYHLTNNLDVKLGYQAMWVEGFAILPEQLDDLAVPLLGDLDMGGSTIYHGFNLGLALEW